jgi:RNA polymerase sigma-70 factor (ECF subfamily)
MCALVCNQEGLNPNSPSETDPMKSDPPNESELRALMIAGLAGDAAAHRELLAALSGRLRGYYRGRLVRAGRSSDETEDLVQEALMAVHTRRHTYDPNEPLTPWVYAIARYKLIDYLRKSQPELAYVPIEDANEVMAHDDRNASESSLDLQKLLVELPERTRNAIQYVKLDGLSVNEAAARCGVSPSAIKVIVHRGMKSLSAILTKRTRDEHR